MSEYAVRERDGVEPGQLVMPFYLICDVSGSMSADMNSLNDGVERLRKAIVAEPIVDEVAQICVMTFSDTSKVVMPMSQMSHQNSVPRLSVEGGTNYGAAFRGLASAIVSDSADLKRQGYKVYRPCAFFLTDGAPNDRDWHQTYTSTLTYDKESGTGLKAHPIFVPFGFRSASEAVLAQLAYPKGRGKYYHVKDKSVEEALKGILDIIMNTVVTAGQTASTAQPAVVPAAPAARLGHLAGRFRLRPRFRVMNKVPYFIGEPGRAALELPDGAPGGRSWPADVELSSAALPGMLIRAATSRGLLHRGRRTPRQDAFALSCRDLEHVIAVVCDGVGEFGRSDEAATLVSRNLADAGAQGVPWPEAFASANDVLRKLAEETAAREDSDSVRDGMATTAVAVSAWLEAGEWVGSTAWIGDSTVWHLAQDGTWTLFAGASGEPEGYYHSSAVRPMPSADGACSQADFRFAGGALFVMSDGVSNPLRWNGRVQEVLAGWWMRAPDAITFAAQVGFAMKTHLDDRTVIGIWPDRGDADGEDIQPV